MPNYPTSFVNTVNQACLDSDEFYRASPNSKKRTPNPYYIGMGNPKSKILIIGKELSIDTNKGKNETQIDYGSRLKTLQNESINNPYLWKQKLKSDEDIKPFDPSYPYGGHTDPDNGGKTWNRYQKLCISLSESLMVSKEKNFHRNFFYTELNIIPAKISKGIKKQLLVDRLTFFKKNPFFLNFEIIILAFGDYLSKNEIEEKSKIEDLFKVKHKKSLSEPRRKLEIYTNNDNNKLVINTRQLSNGVADDYLEKIGNIINLYPNI
jgi:hypothetical protein